MLYLPQYIYNNYRFSVSTNRHSKEGKIFGHFAFFDVSSVNNNVSHVNDTQGSLNECHMTYAVVSTIGAIPNTQ